ADLASRVKNYSQAEAVLCWQLGSNLTSETVDVAQQAVRTVRENDSFQGRPVGGGLWDGFRPYGRNLDVLSVYRYPIYTGLELDDYWDWLESRGNLAGSSQYLWTWIQTHAPDWLYARLADQSPPGSDLQGKLATLT